MFQVKIEVSECTECKRTETARWYYKTTSNPICCSCYRKRYVSANREKALAAQRKANSSDKSKLARKAYAKSEHGRALWKRCNRYLDPIRKKSLKNASFNEKYKTEIKEIYNTCPEGFHVDHIIPLKAKALVNGEYIHVASGLHVPWNLQHLSALDNIQKHCNLNKVASEDLRCQYIFN